jgi:hypothetical protein
MAMFVAVVSLSSMRVGAQEDELEFIARAYFEVLQTEGMTSVGQFMHPNALVEFKDMLLPVFEAEASAGDAQLRAVTFGNQATIDDVRNQDPESFMNGFMNIIAAQAGDIRISFDKLEVLGVVPEGEQRHVLTRITVGADQLELTEFEVLSFIPFEGSWRLQLNGEMKGLAAALASQL